MPPNVRLDGVCCIGDVDDDFGPSLRYDVSQRATDVRIPYLRWRFSVLTRIKFAIGGPPKVASPFCSGVSNELNPGSK